jgi:4-amino-4-deoxy-L-arabinose transferase-like glycosyltransferase
VTVATAGAGHTAPLILILELGLLVIVYVLPAYLIARLAERKGHSFGGFLLGGLVVGWIFSGLVVVFIRPRPARRL